MKAVTTAACVLAAFFGGFVAQHMMVGSVGAQDASASKVHDQLMVKTLVLVDDKGSVRARLMSDDQREGYAKFYGLRFFRPDGSRVAEIGSSEAPNLIDKDMIEIGGHALFLGTGLKGKDATTSISAGYMSLESGDTVRLSLSPEFASHRVRTQDDRLSKDGTWGTKWSLSGDGLSIFDSAGKARGHFGYRLGTGQGQYPAALFIGEDGTVKTSVHEESK